MGKNAVLNKKYSSIATLIYLKKLFVYCGVNLSKKSKKLFNAPNLMDPLSWSDGPKGPRITV